jgi:YVTN family beta-propeller protein
VQILQNVRAASVVFAVCIAAGAEFHPPAGERYAQIATQGTILPGGRILKPFGREIETGPGPSGLAVSPKGLIATANTGFERYGITVIEPSAKGAWREENIWARTPHGTAPEIADPDWKGVSGGIVFDSDKTLWVAEGESGKIRQLDIHSGDRRKIVSLNTGELRNSFAGTLAYDVTRRLLYVVDRTHSRVVLLDARGGNIISSVEVGSMPSEIALVPDGTLAYATTAGMVCAIDVRDSLHPTVSSRIEMDSPRGIVATADRVFVSNSRSDSIAVISTRDNRVTAEIPLGIPSLEQFRGVMPAGLAYDPLTKWLLVAEWGINAVGVVDTEKNQSIGHIPVGWRPSQVAISGDRVYVTNVLGRGTGPNLRRPLLAFGEVPMVHRGSLTTFIMPDLSEVLRQTGTVFAANGFIPGGSVPPLPAAIKHVVLIVNEPHTFDEVLGDLARAPQLARYGMHGRAQGGPAQFSVQDAQITPNQHAVGQSWAFSDNFYADEGGFESRLADVWRHLDEHGVTYKKVDDIAAVEQGNLPQFIYIRLSRKHATAEGHRYEASFVEENDLEIGRIVESLSRSPEWRETAVFITSNDTGDGLDHIDSHRTVLLAAGPYVKRNYVSHTNSDSAGLLRTIFELLLVPSLRLSDATAASLRDLFTDQPDLMPFTAQLPDKRIFDPAKR